MIKGIIAAATIALAATTARAELVGQILVPFENGDFYLIYQLSDIRAPSERCNGYEGGRGVLISATDRFMFPRTIAYASGCWYVNRAKDVILIGRAIQGENSFVHSYPADMFEQTPKFWPTAIGEQ